LLAHAGRGGGRGLTEAAAEIARAAARSWLAPLLDTACDRLAFVLGSLFDLALERNRRHDSACMWSFFLAGIPFCLIYDVILSSLLECSIFFLKSWIKIVSYPLNGV